MGSEKEDLHMDKTLLKQAQIRPALEDRKGASPQTIIGFAFLTFNSVLAVYSSNRDLGAIFSVGFFILDLVLLFYCLSLYKRTPPESPRREHLKMAVWLLTTMLTFAFFTLLEFCFLATGDVAVKTL